MNADRRKFIKTSAIATAAIGTFPTIINACSSPAEKVNVALIGCRSMGFSNLNIFLNQENVECLALCDVDAQILENRAADVEKKTGKRPDIYSDFRKILDRTDVDAVIIGTPDHWHHKQTVDSLAAGLNVYCEKPMTKTVQEAFDVEAKWKASGKVMQVGVQSTSLNVWDEIRALLQDGKLNPRSSLLAPRQLRKAAVLKF